MARKVKCPICGELNDKNTAQEHKKRFYCPLPKECLSVKLAEEEEKSGAGKDWIELYEYITKLYGEKPTGRMFKQLAEYRKEPYNYTNKGMYLTLEYFYDTLENDVLEGTGVGIIPYMYDNAKKNYIKNMEISEYNKEFESKETIKLINVKDTLNGRRGVHTKLISFDDIDDDEDAEEEENVEQEIKTTVL